ncbi:MAG: hypothetical protein JSU57_03130 [Candidatus Heimdallarchaeota archaeon]|nr:MAG: hypothetical protein JSU57_03130 [Candidatus Heimdallarchaeota archaeon]
MNDTYPNRQFLPADEYIVRASYSKIRRGKLIEISIYLSCLTIIGYTWVWLLAFWWLVSFRRVDEEFIAMWKNYPEFEGHYPFQRTYRELITTNWAYQQKLRMKNATKILLMALLAIPIFGYFLLFVVTILTLGIVFVVYYYRIQIPNRYLSQIITQDSQISRQPQIIREVQVRPQPPAEKGIYCERCGKKLPQRARFCDTCAYPVRIPKEEEISFKQVSFRQATELLDSERYHRGTQMNIEFECVVLQAASPERSGEPAPYRTIRVTDPGHLITRTLHVWGDPDHRYNIELVSSLKPGERLLIIGPRRPKDSPYYKDEENRDVFWIERWDGTISDPGTRLVKLEDISTTKVEEEPLIKKPQELIEFAKEAPSAKPETITPPFYCQLCSIKHIAGTPRMQCDTCGRLVCIEAFAEMAQVGRTNCPMCDGKLISV